MLIKVINGEIVQYPYALRDLKREHFNVSFPRQLSAEILAGFNVYEVVPTDKPKVSVTQTISEGTPQNVNGVWTQVWVVTDLDTEKKAEALRQARNLALEVSDLRVIRAAEKGMALSQEWQDYRQALRDLPSNPDFPNVELPHDPDYKEVSNG